MTSQLHVFTWCMKSPARPGLPEQARCNGDAAVIWFFKLNDISRAVARECPLAKSCCDSETGDGIAGLEMWIENDFDNRKNPAGLKGVEQFGEGCRTIRYFPEDCNENHAIKVIGGCEV